jgi:hypothetical protein
MQGIATLGMNAAVGVIGNCLRTNVPPDADLESRTY